MSRPLPDSVLDRIADILIAASERIQREAEEAATEDRKVEAS